MCAEDSRDCRCYVSYTGIKLPLKLVNQLEPADVDNRNTFFRGHFDGQDRLTFCEKIVYGEIEMTHRYEYHPGGTLALAEIVTPAEDDIVVLHFDETGAPLEA